MKKLQNTFIIVLLLTINNVIAQTETNYNKLQNKLWKFEKHEEAIDLYTPTKIKSFHYGKLLLELDYYLSETEVTEGNFDSTKVGNSTIGKYIITINNCYEIINISDEILTIRNTRNQYYVNLFAK